MKIISLKKQKHGNLFHRSETAFNGTVVNQALSSLQGGLLDISLTVSEFNESKPRVKSPKNRFQLSAGLNLEKLITILSGTKLI